MDQLRAEWATQQLAEFLAVVSGATDEETTLRRAVERAAESFEAEVAVVGAGDRLRIGVGFADGECQPDALVEAIAGAAEKVDLPPLGSCRLMSAPIEEGPWRLAVARAADEPFLPDERNLLRGMARVLGLTMAMLERQKLLERLVRIQRSISLRAPLQEVLDSITAGAMELLLTDTAGLRVIDPRDPDRMILVSSSGIPAEMESAIRHRRVGEGVGGRAILENRLVVADRYDHAPSPIPEFTADGLQAAMAAPVHQDGAVIGSLVVATYREGRAFSKVEQHALTAFAEHASLALTDARTVEAMREAQRSRDMFLAMISHELKTPLTVMMGTMKTLEARGPELDPGLVRELVAAGYQRGRDLERLIDKLLVGARAQLAGRPEEVRLPDVVADAVRGFGSSRTLVLDEIPDRAVHVDPTAVVQVVGALIENAATHSLPGTPVRVGVGLDRGRVEVRVENQGTLPEDLGDDELFSPFRRGEAARSPGVGLGLYIARRVARSIGGEVMATRGEGTVTFTLAFPVGSR
jgi:signal transduction histidine kinase